jgi:hypothetical protein
MPLRHVFGNVQSQGDDLMQIRSKAVFMDFLRRNLQRSLVVVSTPTNLEDVMADSTVCEKWDI